MDPKKITLVRVLVRVPHTESDIIVERGETAKCVLTFCIMIFLAILLGLF